jgi:hypothetical protein
LLAADRAILAEAFASSLDPAMSSYGFTRRDGSLIYRRAEPAADQLIDIGVARHPYYHSTAWFHLQPWCRLTYPDVERELALLDIRGRGTPRRTISVGLELLKPEGRVVREVYVECPDGPGEAAEALIDGTSRLREVLATLFVPFLDRVRSPEGLVALYKDAQASGRPAGWRTVPELLGGRPYAAVAIAAVLTGEPDVARLVLSRDLAKKDAEDARSALHGWMSGRELSSDLARP